MTEKIQFFLPRTEHLRRDGENWVIDAPDTAGQPLTTEQLAAKLRSPLPMI